MKNIRYPVALALASALLFAHSVSAETFRCGQWIASKDMTVAELLEKCGEPTNKSVRYEDIYAKSAGGGTNRIGTATIETWTYDRSQSFDMIVTIVDGKIKSMERGD